MAEKKLSKKQLIGLSEDLQELSQPNEFARLAETGNHATFPDCRCCINTEVCLEHGPSCKSVRQTIIK